MKTSVVLFSVLLVATWIFAQQRVPPGPAELFRPAANTNAAPAAATANTNAPANTNQVADMLKSFRARTNAASNASATNVVQTARPNQNPPTVSPSANTNLAQRPVRGLNNRAIVPPGANPATATIPNPPTGAPAPVVLPQIPAPQTVDGRADLEQVIPAGMIQVQGMQLDQFFEIYSMVSGRTVLRPYQIQGSPQGITLKAQTDWTRREAIFAMDAALALNGVAMIPVGEKFVKAVPSATAPTEGSDLTSASTNENDYANSDQFVTQVIELKTLRPSELAPLLATFSKIQNSITPFDNNNTIVLREHASNVKRMIEVIQKIDVARESDYKLEVIPIKYGKVTDLYNTMASLISGQPGTTGTGTTTTPRSTGSRLGSSGSGSRLGQNSANNSSYGMQNRNGLQPQQLNNQPGNVGAAQNTFQNRLRNIIQNAAGGQGGEVQVLEDARIVPDERSNTLLIFANKRDMTMITNIVSKVDVLLAQVLIEAVIMEVQLGDSHSLGVSLAQNPKRFGSDFTGAGGYNNGQTFLNNITNFPGALPSGFSYFGKIAGDLDVAVSAIASDSTINVISRPRIQTSHAIPGSFMVVETVPYVSGSYDNYYGGIGGGLGSRSIVERVDVGITLDVTPYITPEGLVVMDIAQEASNRGQDVIIDNNPIPILNRRSAQATLTVRDGQSIMLGGFITDTKNKSNSGVPVLKDIPLLGNLFKTKNSSNNRSELVVLMRARVLQSPDDAAIVATEEKSQLPGIQQAEKSLQNSTKKQLDKAKKEKGE